MMYILIAAAAASGLIAWFNVEELGELLAFAFIICCSLVVIYFINTTAFTVILSAFLGFCFGAVGRLMTKNKRLES